MSSLLCRRRSYGGTPSGAPDDVRDDVDRQIRRCHEKFEVQKAKITDRSKIVKKYKMAEGFYLTDHTVAEDDPRILRSFNAMTRIRRRSGFDATLIRDKVWAAKITKDLSSGLLKLDRIEIDRSRQESGTKRVLDHERAAMNKRQNRILRTQTDGHCIVRSRSVSDSFVSNITLANHEMEQNLARLNNYVSDLEARGGFVSPVTGSNIKPETETYCEVSLSDIEKNSFVDDEDMGLSMFPKIDGADSRKQRFPRRWSVIDCSNNRGFNLALPSISATYEDRNSTSHRALKRAFFSAPNNLNKLK